MNFYPFHLGDYKTHTSHLTPLEDLAYRRLIDHYYLTESPLPSDFERLSRLIGMRDHADIVIDIVSEFFVKTDAGWTSKRCDEEIAKYKARAERASKLADKRWHRTEKKCDVVSDIVSDTHTESSATNTNTNTKDTKPVSKKVAVPAPDVVIPEAINTEKFKAAWEAYLAYRKEMRFKTLKVSSIVSLLEKLATWGEDVSIDAINTSIRNGWQGIFEPKTAANAVPNRNPINKPSKFAQGDW